VDADYVAFAENSLQSDSHSPWKFTRLNIREDQSAAESLEPACNCSPYVTKADDADRQRAQLVPDHLVPNWVIWSPSTSAERTIAPEGVAK
jgi:hypothetical protein